MDIVNVNKQALAQTYYIIDSLHDINKNKVPLYLKNMIYEYMGSVATYSDLPASGMNAGDVYMIEAADPTHNIAAGDDVMWNGSEWELLNAVISSDQIDTIIDSIS